MRSLPRSGWLCAVSSSSSNVTFSGTRNASVKEEGGLPAWIAWPAAAPHGLATRQAALCQLLEALQRPQKPQRMLLWLPGTARCTSVRARGGALPSGWPQLAGRSRSAAPAGGGRHASWRGPRARGFRFPPKDQRAKPGKRLPAGVLFACFCEPARQLCCQMAALPAV